MFGIAAGGVDGGGVGLTLILQWIEPGCDDQGRSDAGEVCELGLGALAVCVAVDAEVVAEPVHDLGGQHVTCGEIATRLRVLLHGRGRIEQQLERQLPRRVVLDFERHNGREVAARRAAADGDPGRIEADLRGMVERPLQRLDRVVVRGRELVLGRERSEEHTSELQSRQYLVCRLLLEKKKKKKTTIIYTTQKKKKKTIYIT